MTCQRILSSQVSGHKPLSHAAEGEGECFNFHPTLTTYVYLRAVEAFQSKLWTMFEFFNLMKKCEFAIDVNLYYYFDTDIAFRMTVFTFISPSHDLLIWFLPKNR